MKSEIVSTRVSTKTKKSLLKKAKKVKRTLSDYLRLRLESEEDEHAEHLGI